MLASRYTTTTMSTPTDERARQRALGRDDLLGDEVGLLPAAVREEDRAPVPRPWRRARARAAGDAPAGRHPTPAEPSASPAPISPAEGARSLSTVRTLTVIAPGVTPT